MHTTITPQGNNRYVIGGYDPNAEENVTGTYTIDPSNEDNPVEYESGDCSPVTWPNMEVLTREQAEALINGGEQDNFIKLTFDYSSWDDETGGNHTAEVVYSMNSDHTVGNQVSITKGCEQDTINYLGDNEIQYSLYNVNEGYVETTQNFIIEYDSADDIYAIAWGDGDSNLEQPTLTQLTSV